MHACRTVHMYNYTYVTMYTLYTPLCVGNSRMLPFSQLVRGTVAGQIKKKNRIITSGKRR